jgi:hypothetical protein
MRKILNRLKRGQGADSKELVSHDSGPTFRVSAADTLDRATSMCPESSEPRPEGPGLGEESAAVKTPLPVIVLNAEMGEPAANPSRGPVNFARHGAGRGYD